jgi:hypothetical protein
MPVVAWGAHSPGLPRAKGPPRLNIPIVFNTLPTYPLPGFAPRIPGQLPNRRAHKWARGTLPIAIPRSATLHLVADTCKSLILLRWQIIFCSHPHFSLVFCGRKRKNRARTEKQPSADARPTGRIWFQRVRSCFRWRIQMPALLPHWIRARLR